MRKLYFLGHTPKIGMMLTGVCVMGLQSLYDLMLDTYPPLYTDLRFAPWPEEDDPENYCLISLSDGGVIRRSTSYCAWKIFELTGSFPIRKTRRRFGSKPEIDYFCTTYENFAFKVCQIEHARRDVTWVQID